MNLLLLTNKLDHSDGVASYLLHLSHGLRDAAINVSVYCAGGNSIENFEREGIKVYINKNFNHERRSVINFAASAKEILNLVKKTKSDILHSHNHYAANISHYVSKLCGISTIQTIHGLIPETGFLNHFKADRFITVNEIAREYLISKRIARANNIQTIRAGIPFEDNIQKKSHPKLKIICASRLVEEKGVDVYIEAVSMLKKNILTNAEFLIAGSGPLGQQLKELSAKLSSEVTFLGEVNNMRKLFRETDIVVYPTRCRTEGFPMTIIEAASMKNLVIASEFDSLKEIFEDRLRGFVFQIDDAAELASKLEYAVINFSESREIRERFYARSKKLFNLRICVEKHLHIYNECLKK